MITRIKGKNITNFYSVKDNKTTKAVDNNELKTIYTARPELVKEAKVECSPRTGKRSWSSRVV